MPKYLVTQVRDSNGELYPESNDPKTVYAKDGKSAVTEYARKAWGGNGNDSLEQGEEYQVEEVMKPVRIDVTFRKVTVKLEEVEDDA